MIVAAFLFFRNLFSFPQKENPMREEITYQWRVRWAGKWSTTRHHCTEEHIRKEHPEAVCLVETKRVQSIPETPAEIAALHRANSTSGFLYNP